jgi:hypothetical protein
MSACNKIVILFHGDKAGVSGAGFTENGRRKLHDITCGIPEIWSNVADEIDPDEMERRDALDLISSVVRIQ